VLDARTRDRPPERDPEEVFRIVGTDRDRHAVAAQGGDGSGGRPERLFEARARGEELAEPRNGPDALGTDEGARGVQERPGERQAEQESRGELRPAGLALAREDRRDRRRRQEEERELEPRVPGLPLQEEGEGHSARRDRAEVRRGDRPPAPRERTRGRRRDDQKEMERVSGLVLVQGEIEDLVRIGPRRAAEPRRHVELGSLPRRPGVARIEPEQAVQAHDGPLDRAVPARRGQREMQDRVA